jgi:hypothetical protein
VDEADIQRRIEAAVEEAQRESDESMNDLLVCLGQEEAKVGRCSPPRRLAADQPDTKHMSSKLAHCSLGTRP